jgi:hypothetical protein
MMRPSNPNFNAPFARRLRIEWSLKILRMRPSILACPIRPCMPDQAGAAGPSPDSVHPAGLHRFTSGSSFPDFAE